jgi:flagellar motility protein MotE (MotC chaperone)
VAPHLKVFRAHLGFYDSVVAVTSQKKALEAWGASPQEFRHGFAAETSDPVAVRAALAAPGAVLRRPFGSAEDFALEPSIPVVKGTLRKKPKQKPDRRAEAAKALAARKAAAQQDLDRKLEALDAEEKKLSAAREKARAAYEKKVGKR